MRFLESSTSGRGGGSEVVVYRVRKEAIIQISINSLSEAITIRVKDIWGGELRKRVIPLKSMIREAAKKRRKKP
jgi:hypothetical protein